MLSVGTTVIGPFIGGRFCAALSIGGSFVVRSTGDAPFAALPYPGGLFDGISIGGSLFVRSIGDGSFAALSSPGDSSSAALSIGGSVVFSIGGQYGFGAASAAAVTHATAAGGARRGLGGYAGVSQGPAGDRGGRVRF
jgi:hypothetical protein